MAENKKYYWLKLKRDFFKRHDIRIIEEMPNGKDYILFYLKLLLESIDHEGSLRFSDTIPYNEQMLSVVTNTNIDIVRSAMKLFIELNMMSVFDDQTIYMNEVDKLIGSESASANRVRKHREQQKMLQCNTDVTKCNTEIEIEKETEEEIEKEKEFHSFIHSAEDEYIQKKVEESELEGDDAETYKEELKQNLKQKYFSGNLGKGVVFMSNEQFGDLCDRLSIDELDKYIDIVAQCEINGKHFKKKTHYQAILDMAAKDRRVGK